MDDLSSIDATEKDLEFTTDALNDDKEDSLEISSDTDEEDIVNKTKEDSVSDIETDEDIYDGDEISIITKQTLKTNDMISVHETYSDYYTTTKTTPPFLNKFERAKLLGIRAQMLSAGAQPMVGPPYSDNCYEIALRELGEKKIPLIIRRYLPDKTFEDWRLEDLIINN